MNKLKYTLTKDKTTHVESFNSILRGNLPSLVRKTKVVNHSARMLYKKLYLFLFFYNNKIIKYVDFNYFSFTFTPSIF
jgi:hypothetical protein